MDDRRLEEMERLAVLGQATFAGLTALVGPSGQAGDEAFRHYLAVAREYLAATVAFEEKWPGSFAIQPVAQPLVQQLSIYADYREASGDRETAKALRAEADALTMAYLDPVAAASVTRSRAMEAAAAGRFHDALAGLDEAHRTFAAAGDRIDAAQTLIQLANVYEWLCDYERSLRTLDAAQTLVAGDLESGPPSAASVAVAIGQQLFGILRGRTDTQGEDALGLRRAYYEIVQARARINRFLGNHEAARGLFEEAREFVQEFVGPAVDFHLAAVAVAEGDLDRAGELLAQIEPGFGQGLLRPRRGAVRQIGADLMLARGQPFEALTLAEDGLRDQATYPDLDLAWKLQWRRARALSALGRSDEALSAYRDAAEAADTLRMAPLGYQLDTTFLRDKLPMFEAAIDEALAQGDGPAAVWFIELIKSRALSAILSRPPDAADSADRDAARFDEISVRLDAIAFAMYSGNATVADVQERQALLEERAATLERIRIRDPRWRTMTEPAPIEVGAVNRRLAEREASVLVLYRRGDRVISALLDGFRVTLGERQLGDTAVAALGEYVENLHKAQPDWFLADFSGEFGVGLADFTTDEVALAAASARVLLVVPHGALHLLPWSTMRVGDRRLFEQTAVGVLPNLAALDALDHPLAAAPLVTLFGDPDYSGLQRYLPLPEAGAELADIAAIYGPRRMLTPTMRGAAASEAALLPVLNTTNARNAILHIASHGDIEADSPLSSGLILTDSRLDAAELIRTRCDYSEVVLSACSTGWRPQSTHGLTLVGDDALGLVASFLEAGARSLLVSITQAKDDMARAFSVGWHRHRHGGAPPLVAYHLTQRELFQADPQALWSWAGITYYGCGWDVRGGV